MSKNLTNLLRASSFINDEIAEPTFFRLSKENDKRQLETLLINNPGIEILNQLLAQLKDLIKLENPAITLSDEEYQRLIDKKLGSNSLKAMGCGFTTHGENILFIVLMKKNLFGSVLSGTPTK